MLFRAVAVAVALGSFAMGPGARAQTVLTMTNGGTASGPTILNVANLASASTLGGLSAGAVSMMDQGAFNQLNAMGVSAAGPILPLSLGFSPPIGSAALSFGSVGVVQINMVAGGLLASTGQGFTLPTAPTPGPLSMSIVNSNTASSTGQSLLLGGNPAGGGIVFFGPAPGSTLVGGSQIGINQISAFGQ